MNELCRELLEKKHVFKLILGAANQNISDIENLAAIYAKAGCKFFDVGADIKLISALKRGIEYAICEKDRKDYHICVSIGTKNDSHVNKCKIDKNKCTNCGACIGICPNSAISETNSKFQIEKKNCIGCGACQKICLYNAISKYSINKDLSEILPQISEMEISCLEFHVNLDDEDDFNQKWQQINTMYKGILSICINRGKKSDTEIIRFLNFIIKQREPYSTIIQADGNPMSGGKDDYKSNLQALAFVELLQREQFPAYIIASGGVNTNFAKLANDFELSLTGIAMGSFARNVIKDYYRRPDILTNNLVFNEAVDIAKSIVNSPLNLKY